MIKQSMEQSNCYCIYCCNCSIGLGSK